MQRHKHDQEKESSEQLVENRSRFKLEERLRAIREQYMFAHREERIRCRVGFSILDLSSIPFNSTQSFTVFLPYPVSEMNIKKWVERFQGELLNCATPEDKYARSLSKKNSDGTW